MAVAIHTLPTRLATGAFILHSGWDKWHGSEQQAKGVHGAPAAAFPMLADIEPTRFLRKLATAEIALGAALLIPFFPRRLAGLALTGFAGSLLTMYLRTPAMHKPGSVWPAPAGIAVSKDVWMLGIGLSLLTEKSTT
jgi:uncharacterized membrane protein YphA (DoxX/SURF4 family)